MTTMLFGPETEEGYRKLVCPIQPRNYLLVGYRSEEAVEIMARLWAYPYTQADCYRLMKGEPAEIVVQRFDDVASLKPMPRLPNPVSYLHGCDIVYYRPCGLIGMLHRDRCFVSLDALSVQEAHACMTGESEQGVFVVHQLHARPFPSWSEDQWKAFGCEARPHIRFQFP